MNFVIVYENKYVLVLVNRDVNKEYKSFSRHNMA